MLQVIQHSGLVGLVLIIIAITCAVLIAKAAIRLNTNGKAKLAATRQALLFWGIVAAFLGFIGHTAGVFTALSVIVEADSISGADVANALRVSLSSALLGLAVAVIASLGWLGLGLAGRKITASGT